MNRSNFGRQSGFVLDVCRVHGVWFDAEELDGVLRWVGQGGEKRAAEREHEEQRSAATRERFRVEPRTTDSSIRSSAESSGDADWLRHAFERLFDL